MAYFTDSESSTRNTVQAGTLDLTVAGGNATVSFFTRTNIVPGDSNSDSVTITNAGSLPGYVDVSVDSLTNYENGWVGNEHSKDGSDGDPGQGAGELQNHLQVDAYFQNGGSPVYLGSSGYDLIKNTFDSTANYELDHQLVAGASDTFVIDWQLPSDTGRVAMSDSVELALTFQLGQTGGQ